MGSKRAAWFLAIAMMPMLTYMGHWELPVSWLPAAIAGDQSHHHATGVHVHTASEHRHHTEHCHGEVASCSDIPYAGSATIVFLAYAVDALALRSPQWRQDVSQPLMPLEPPAMPNLPPPRA